jgi:NADH-quinone oxidoreductase subunit L
MLESLVFVIPSLPLLGALILFLIPLPSRSVAVLAVLTVSGSALAVLLIQLNTAPEFTALTFTAFSWLNIGPLSLDFAFYLDPLSLMMVSVITGVGSLIHLYSVSFMLNDKGYQRYFAYLNLFVGAMLILVLADNLLVLYLGWEGVGLCSYLLIGFWSKERNNNRAANKAFITTRIGDTAMLIALLMLFWQFETLNIAQINREVSSVWQANSIIATSCTLLLFIGAAGKSAQLPLQNWLPDAMAGPSPVSALIHAATMVTAGVYLIARNIALFEQANFTMQLIAIVGTLTLLLGASSAMVQTDLKRILAYSTISQLGYMFLALGVGATAAASFHLMTHAFFKALLFLSAGALIHCLDNQHNIFKMGGLRHSHPVIFTGFIVGCGALSSLPLLSGFFSKELILGQVMAANHPWLWFGAIIGAFMTAFYSARLIFIVFFGPLNQQPSIAIARSMNIVIIVLTVLSVVGGTMPTSITLQFPVAASSLSSFVHVLPIIIPFIAVALAYWCFSQAIFGCKLNPNKLSSTALSWCHQLLLNGWHFDHAYRWAIVNPFMTLTQLNKADVIDLVYKGLERVMLRLHQLASFSQTGSLRLYSALLIIFAVVSIGWMLASRGLGL